MIASLAAAAEAPLRATASVLPARAYKLGRASPVTPRSRELWGDLGLPTRLVWRKMEIHHAIWVPAVCLGYGLGFSLLFYGLEKTNGVFSSLYRRVFGRHFGGTLRRLASLEKEASDSQLQPVMEVDADARQSLDEMRPREIALVPVTNGHAANGVQGGSPELRSFRSKLEDRGREDSLGVRQLRSLRSTLTAAVDSFRMSRELLDSISDPAELLDSHTHKGPGLVWVRGCKCQTSCNHKNRWVQPEAHSIVSSALKIGVSTLSAPCDLAWAELSCSVLDTATHRQKPVLRNNGGTVVPGEMLALVGPSGAGKSTLLDILALRKSTGKITGQVYMNGGPRGRPFKRMSAYVAQEDVFEPVLTAWETLQFHAELRLPRRTTRTQKDERMTDAMRSMGLWKSRDTRVGGLLPGGIRVRGLSGGEQRRLSIACALIATPSIIFLDEPTTGLDSFAALNIMEHMSHLAIQGHTIIATIHQPRAAIWAMFHKVDVLSEGFQVYFGPPSRASEWFGSLGYPYKVSDGAVSDWLMDLVSVGFSKPSSYHSATMTTRTHVSHAATMFASEHTEELPMLPSATRSDGTQIDTAGTRTQLRHRFAASWGKQFWVLYTRAMTTQIRNPSDICGRILVTTTIGVLTGLVLFDLPDDVSNVFQHMVTHFFVLITYMLLPFCYMSFYVANRNFYHEEVASKLYHPTAYYLATNLAGWPFLVINTLAGCMATYGLVGLRYQGMAIFLYAVIVVLNSLIALQFLMIAVWVTPNQDIAFVMGVGYTALSILLVDFFITYSELKVPPAQWASWISYTRYSMQGLVYNEYNNRNFSMPGSIVTGLPGASTDEIRQQASGGRASQAINAGFKPTIIRNGTQVLEYYEFFLHPGPVVGVLIGFYVLFHILSYLAMTYLNKKKR